MQKKVKKVYIGSTQVRPQPGDKRTFTITWTEGSNMSSGWTYSDDAAGLTAGSTEFDKFFGYYGCKLNTSGVETAVITQEDSGGYGKLDITQLGTLTSGDNVMIAFPLLGIKMTKNGTSVTLSITKEKNKEGYQYFAHTNSGDINNPWVPKDVFYLGAYKSYLSSSTLKSRSGKSPAKSMTSTTACTRATANGAGYNIMGFYQRMFIAALYMMKYGNPDCKTVVGLGFRSSSTAQSTGATNSQTDATYGTDSRSGRIKLFGLEDRWGNIAEHVGGICTNSSKKIYIALSGYTGAVSTSAPFVTTGITLNTSGLMTKIYGNNILMFAPNTTTSSSTFTTYYCDTSGTTSGSRVFIAGGQTNEGCNVFGIIGTTTSSSSDSYGARIMYL